MVGTFYIDLDLRILIIRFILAINLCRREKTTSKIDIRFFGLGRPTKHRVIATADIDNPKFKVVLLPTIGASSFLNDFLDRYLFAVAFHQLRHRNIGCVTALTFK